jgi:hypothetical protein
MPKRKDAVALFDLISKGRAQQPGPGQGTDRDAARPGTSLNVPGWFSKRPAATPPPAGEAQAAPSLPPPVPPSAFLSLPAAEPLFQVADGRVRISLNYVACATAAMGLIVLLGSAFWLGGRFGPRPTSGSPGTGDALADRVAYRPAAGEANALPKRIKGKYYLIVDRMPGVADKDQKDANAILDYLTTKGQPAVIVKVRPERPGAPERFGVLSLTPFEDRESRDALDFARRIEELGKQYVHPPGCNKYTFSQSRQGRLDPSWHLEK